MQCKKQIDPFAARRAANLNVVASESLHPPGEVVEKAKHVSLLQTEEAVFFEICASYVGADCCHAGPNHLMQPTPCG